MKIAIIGGGISGVSAARLLVKNHQVKIFEKESTLGGLIRCEDVNGNLYHKVGGHVFNSKNQKVNDWFWSFFDRENEFIKAKRNAKILLNGQYVGYPLENYLYQLDNGLTERVIDELLDLSKKPLQEQMSYPDFEAFLKGNFGSTLYELYFKPYNYKIWKTDLSEVSLEWLEGKLPMPDYRQIIVSNILQKEESEMVHSSFYYPKGNGSQFIIDRLGKGINKICNYPVYRMKKTSSGWTINDGEEFDKVVYTGDVRKLSNLLITEPCDVQEVLHGVDGLLSNGTSNLFCECDASDLSWLYLPDPAISAHRIIYTGNFSKNNNSGKRKTCVVEFSGKVEKDSMESELVDLPGNLQPLAYNFEANSYVIQQKDTRVRIAQVKDALEPLGFYLLGRFAEWEYYNMDKAMEAAFKTCEIVEGR